MVLLLWGLKQVGLGGLGWATTLVILGGASTVAAVLTALKEVASEDLARRAAPFLVLAPAAVWIATSADALFAGISAWGVTLLLLATGRQGRKSDLLAVAGGLLLAVTGFMSYGLVPLGAVALLVSLNRKSVRPPAIATGVVLVVVALFGLAGFWWWAGLQATIRAYFRVAPRSGHYWFFMVTNLAAFAIALGPAVAAGLTRLRDRKAWLLTGGALVAIAVAEISGLSKGEVERIWLPFAPWLLAAGLALENRRFWLGLQAAAAIGVQVLVRTPW